jgi:hypothetical protein
LNKIREDLDYLKTQRSECRMTNDGGEGAKVGVSHCSRAPSWMFCPTPPSDRSQNMVIVLNILSRTRNDQYSPCALEISASGYSSNGPMAYLRPTTKIPNQDSCDLLSDWLPKAEFSAAEDAPHMRLCRNVPLELLRPFQKEVSEIRKSSFLLL